MPKTGAAISVNGRSANFARRSFSIFFLALSIALLAGCGAPGEPQPPSPPIPAADHAILPHISRATACSSSLRFRDAAFPANVSPNLPPWKFFAARSSQTASPDNKSFKLVYTIPGALADVYATQRQNSIYRSAARRRVARASRRRLRLPSAHPRLQEKRFCRLEYRQRQSLSSRGKNRFA